ncbi:MAG: S41 family peptidase [Phycisphaerales bacterium]|nr:S41 family peptidase [Phycisphaerales bacterium]
MLRTSKRLGMIGLLMSTAAAAMAQQKQDVHTAFGAILRGDYDGGRTALAVLKQAGADDRVSHAEDWLSEYRSVVEQRDKLRQDTYDWMVEQGRKALDEGKVYVALRFANQARAYSNDQDTFPKQDWVIELKRRALEVAQEKMTEEKWSTAWAYYATAAAIDPKDKGVRDFRKAAARHARLDTLYDSDEDVQRRLEDVAPDLLLTALRRIDDNYYTEPDFLKMGQGALDSLLTLATTPKMFERFPGLGSPNMRESFVSLLREKRNGLDGTTRYTRRDLEKLFQDIARVNRETVELPTGLLVVEFTEGAMEQLDEFSSMVWPADVREFEKMLVGQFYGVGIQLGVDEDTKRLKVVTPLEASPALAAGVRPDDLIVRVDGETTKGWTTDQAVRNITGPEGTKVTLTMFRPSTGRYIDFPLTRSRIELTTTRGVHRIDGSQDKWDYMLDPQAGIAYIKLTGFNPNSQAELDLALRDADMQGMRGLILDLRNNPGGLLDIAISAVSTFLDHGEVVSTEGLRERTAMHRVTGGAKYPDLPLVVLVNDGSASASEILSGVLQDHDRAVVLGERTFGKGSVQRVMNLATRFGRDVDARLKLTTALYHIQPSGRTPHKANADAETWGIDPDWKVELMPKEMIKVIERQNQAYVIQNGTDEAEAKPEGEAVAADISSLRDDTPDDSDEEELMSESDLQWLRSDPYEAPDVDPQLETALLQMRVKLAGNLPWPRQIAQKSDTIRGG